MFNLTAMQNKNLFPLLFRLPTRICVFKTLHNEQLHSQITFYDYKKNINIRAPNISFFSTRIFHSVEFHDQCKKSDSPFDSTKVQQFYSLMVQRLKHCAIKLAVSS